MLIKVYEELRRFYSKYYKNVIISLRTNALTTQTQHFPLIYLSSIFFVCIHRDDQQQCNFHEDHRDGSL